MPPVNLQPATLPSQVYHSTTEPQRPGGGTLIFSYIHRLGPFFGGRILNFNIFGGFQKNEYFFGYEHFVDIFLGVIPKLD